MKQKIKYDTISVEDELPELNKFVPCIDSAGEIIIYRRVDNTPPKAIGLQWAWNMRDGVGVNSPNNNLPITHWLKKVEQKITGKPPYRCPSDGDGDCMYPICDCQWAFDKGEFVKMPKV